MTHSRKTRQIFAWDKLRYTTLASLITFNRRRQGEVSKMLLAGYGKIIPGDTCPPWNRSCLHISSESR